MIGVSLDGRVLWRFPLDSKNGATTPVLADSQIIVSTGDRVIAFRPRLRDGVWSVETVWETKEVTTYVSSPVLADGVLFGLSTKARGQFFAIDAKTGQVLWLGEPRAADNTAIVKSRSILFLLNDDGELILARVSRRGFEPIVRYTVADSATWAQPAISGNRIFIKDTTTLSLWTRLTEGALRIRITSTRAARRAGMMQATQRPRSRYGHQEHDPGVRWRDSIELRRDQTAERQRARTPTATPPTANPSPSRSTSPTMARGALPIARRTPISRPRCATK